jgi:hypothetical protein
MTRSTGFEVLATGALLALLGCSPGASQAPSTSSPAAIAIASPTSAATPTPQPSKVLYQQSLSGSHAIDVVVPAYLDHEIDMAYSYTCPGAGSFIVNSTDAIYPDPFSVNETNDHGSGILVDNHLQRNIAADGTNFGEVSVQVSTKCPWTITVTAVPSPQPS